MNKKHPQRAAKFCLLFILFFSSCYDENFVRPEMGSQYKEHIIDFLQSKKTDVSEENVGMIDDLIAKLDLTR